MEVNEIEMRRIMEDQKENFEQLMQSQKKDL